MGLINVLWKGGSLKQDSSNRLVTDTEKSTWNSKANSSHTHIASNITNLDTYLSNYKFTTKSISDFPASLKNPESLTITLNGGTTEGYDTFTYDGSSSYTINITPSRISAVPISGGTMTGNLLFDSSNRTIGSSLTTATTNPAIYATDVTSNAFHLTQQGSSVASLTRGYTDNVLIPTLRFNVGGNANKYVDLKPSTSLSSYVTVYLPSSNGTLALTDTANGKYRSSDSKIKYETQSDTTNSKLWCNIIINGTTYPNMIEYATKVSTLAYNDTSITIDASSLDSLSSRGVFRTGDNTGIMTQYLIGAYGSAGIRLQENIVSDYFYVFPIGQNKNDAYLGTSSAKWAAIYATNGTIQTSNELKKNIIKDGIDNRYEELYKKLEPIAFTWNNNTADGDNHDRVHLGLGAQTTKKHMDEVGISAEEYALYCEDNILDDDGNDIGEKEYGLNYGQLHALHIHMIQKLLERVNKLETELAEIKNK